MILKRTTQVFLALMALAFCKAGIEALLNPQAVLSNVGIELNNPSALSSMRAVYGGMHLVFGLFCFWGSSKVSRSHSCWLCFIPQALWQAEYGAGRLMVCPIRLLPPGWQQRFSLSQ